MALDVLQPVVRRRRYRYHRGRIGALVVLALVAAAAGAWAGLRSNARQAAAAPRVVRRAPHLARAKAPAARTRPERLLVAGPRVRHRFVPALSAKAAILVDDSTGRVLWGLRAHERRHVASTTKIMTALVALKHLAPHDVVRVDPYVQRVPLVKEGLRPHERVQAWKLFYGMLLYSANDDAVALAIAAGGSRGAFIGEMNAEARRLGLADTHFDSPSGVIDRGNYSSAWDLAALTRVALRNERFALIVRTKRKEVPWSAPTFAKVYLNKNLLLGTYPGADGVKTGYTSLAGHCLVASAKRGGRTVIAVVLDDPNMYVDAKRLLNLGFRAARS